MDYPLIKDLIGKIEDEKDMKKLHDLFYKLIEALDIYSKDKTVLKWLWKSERSYAINISNKLVDNLLTTGKIQKNIQKNVLDFIESLKHALEA